MFHDQQNIRLRFLARTLLGLTALACANAWAQSSPSEQAGPATLSQAFDAAWSRQPEAQSLLVRRDAVEAQRRQADAWTVEPPALELSTKTDRINKNEGSREYEAGIALPLWLPGERSRSAALADAEANALASSVFAAQLRTAAAVREAWWNWQRLFGEQSLATVRLSSARRLAEDVARRVAAGDLAVVDLHQAEGAAATAEIALAEADIAMASARQQFRALVGSLPVQGAADSQETEPPITANSVDLGASHPAVAGLLDRAEVARRSAELAIVQTRSNPELRLVTTRERGAFGDDWARTLTVAVRIPFGSESRNRAKVGLARAEALEMESQLRLQRERLATELETSRARVESVRIQLAAADRRAIRARESLAFLDKSYRLGETDLPTRLRIALDAAEAERQAVRARIDLAAAISALRQAMGLLPERQ